MMASYCVFFPVDWGPSGDASGTDVFVKLTKNTEFLKCWPGIYLTGLKNKGLWQDVTESVKLH